MPRRILRSIVLAAVLLVASVAPAWAHVEIDPAQATAGSTTTLTFSFHHGKDGSATTALSVRLPEGARLVDVPATPGWSSETSTEGGHTVVTWSGGSVPDGQEASFPIELTLPAASGEVLFPTIQTTEAGELAWIEATEDDSEGGMPAPRITLVADPTATTTTTTTTEAPTTSTTSRLPGTTNQAEQRDDGDESPALWLIGGGVAAAALIGAGGWWLSRRG